MNKAIKTGITLALIAAIAATALALINSITAPKIAEYEAQVVLNALSEVAPGYDIKEKEDVTDGVVNSLYPIYKDDVLEGYIVSLKGNGYGGEFNLMVSYTLKGSVIDARLLANSETPGLGKKAEKGQYMEKFQNTGGNTPVPVKKGQLDKDEADSIGGSTVTFSAIAKTIAYGSSFVEEKGGK
ncbi:MAG: FMN-binding protein [Spirochaetia bacterium]|nr:FMN-binding protein [Spirochaetia bacterium]